MASVYYSVSRVAAQDSRGPGRGVEVCSQEWRGVESSGIVSHPSRQQSGGVGSCGSEEAAGGCSVSSIHSLLCDDAYGASSDPRARDGSRDASVVWWSSGVVRGRWAAEDQQI
jgi:hypothetical protein